MSATRALARIIIHLNHGATSLILKMPAPATPRQTLKTASSAGMQKSQRKRIGAIFSAIRPACAVNSQRNCERRWRAKMKLKIGFLVRRIFLVSAIKMQLSKSHWAALDHQNPMQTRMARTRPWRTNAATTSMTTKEQMPTRPHCLGSGVALVREPQSDVFGRDASTFAQKMMTGLFCS